MILDKSGETIAKKYDFKGMLDRVDDTDTLISNNSSQLTVIENSLINNRVIKNISTLSYINSRVCVVGERFTVAITHTIPPEYDLANTFVYLSQVH